MLKAKQTTPIHFHGIVCWGRLPGEGVLAGEAGDGAGRRGCVSEISGECIDIQTRFLLVLFRGQGIIAFLIHPGKQERFGGSALGQC